jgi:hypothetical protein
MKSVITNFKFIVASWVLSHPALLETIMKYPTVANALLTPARVVVLVSNQSIRKR